MAIPAARLLSRSQHVLPGKLHIAELFFEVPKNYAAPRSGTLKLFGRVVNKTERPAGSSGPVTDLVSKKPFLVYLEGGPGFGNWGPGDHPVTKFFLERGYQLLYLDYRGTGLSTPINARHVTSLGDAAVQADYLKLFRQDNIVRDLEAVRRCLTADLPADQKKWSIIGQSFGGFVSLTYLSKFPASLRESFITGGLAPLDKTPDETLEHTYKHVVKRNKDYYGKFLQDVERVKQIVLHITKSDKVALPNGGRLTVGRFLNLGHAFGAHGGLNAVHALVLKMAADLDQFGFLTRSALVAFELTLPLDTAPIYGILHEQIYCTRPGVASNWAGARVGLKLKEFAWIPEAPGQGINPKFVIPPEGEPIFFAGEMVYPYHLDTYPELAELRDAADLLARYDQWEELYDEEVLAKNEVPVYAVSYVDDMYVDFELARETVSKVKGIKVFETNGLYHNALRAESEKVLGELCKLRDEPKD